MSPFRIVSALFLAFFVTVSVDSHSPEPPPLPQASLAANELGAFSNALSLVDVDQEDVLEEIPYWPAPDPFEGLTEEEIAVLVEAKVEPESLAAPSTLTETIESPIEASAVTTAFVQRPTGPALITNDQIFENAQALLGVPYLWGGNTTSGMDCSAYVSRAWGVPRQTTDTLYRVAYPISKEELVPGDVMNLTKREDPRGYGHVRLFAAWANSEHTFMWVYEETPQRAVYHAIPYDPRYTPMRRQNFESDGVVPLIAVATPSPRRKSDLVNRPDSTATTTNTVRAGDRAGTPSRTATPRPGSQPWEDSGLNTRNSQSSPSVSATPGPRSRTPLERNRQAQPSQTASPQAIRTPTTSPTPRPPTATPSPRPTRTPTPSPTATMPASATPRPPTRTPTVTRTPTPQPEATVAPRQSTSDQPRTRGSATPRSGRRSG